MMKKEILDLFELVKKQVENKGFSDEELNKRGALKFKKSLDACYE